MYVHLLSIIAFTGITVDKQVNGELQDIRQKLNNSCSISETFRGPRSASELNDIIEMLQPISQTVWLEFKTEYSVFCPETVSITIPMPITKMEAKRQLRTYYSWLLWIQEAKSLIDKNFGSHFFYIEEFDLMTNYLRQAVCAANINSTELPDLPCLSSLDPVDYLEPTCNILKNFKNFISEARNLLRRNRQRQHSWI